MADIFDWSATAANNTTLDGINVNTGMSPGNVDNGIRALMALVRNTFVPSWEGLFAGTTSGIPVSNGSGTISAKAAPSGDIVGTSDTQTLTNKTLTGATISSLAAALPVGSGGTGVTTLAALLGDLFTVTSNANGICIAMNVDGTTYKLQWGRITASANGTSSITFPEAYTTLSTISVSGSGVTAGSTGSQDNAPAISAYTTSGASVFSADDSSATFHWIAMGY